MKQLNIFCLLLILFSYTVVSAQSADRKGFHFAFGVGPALSAYKVDGSFSKPDPALSLFYDGNPILSHVYDEISDIGNYPLQTSGIGLQTNLNIGFGLTENVLISYMNRVAYTLNKKIHRTDYYSNYNSSVLLISGLTGIEVEYYLSQSTNSPYVAVGGGMSIFTQPFVSGYFTKTGWGSSFAAGYQFSAHLAGEINVMYLSGTMRDKIKSEIENLSDGIAIDGSYKNTSVSINLKYVLF